jgi:hypothetical protein
MFLDQDADRVWRGAWLDHERMPVELIPEEEIPLQLAAWAPL